MQPAARYLRATASARTWPSRCSSTARRTCDRAAGRAQGGRSFVPLDPAYPRERCGFMIAESGASLVLTPGTFLDASRTPASRRRLDDGSWRRGEHARPRRRTPSRRPVLRVSPRALTGEPKGVAVTIGTSCASSRRRIRRAVAGGRRPDAGAGLLRRLHARAVGARPHGGRLAIFPPITPSLAELGDSSRHQLTTAWLTASLLHPDVEHRRRAFAGSVAPPGGDGCRPVRRARSSRRPGNGTLVNGYGPTENTTFTCCHAMTDAAGLGDDVPIGRPITNTQAYVLDGALSPAPVGMVGELYAGGDGLARGYRGRPALTADRFVPDPCGGRPGARLYRTGDRARWRDDGTIEFLGRVDRQVKIRGFRVEPCEIERQLSAHTRWCGTPVVDVRARLAGRQALVAYFVPKDEADGADTTRRALASSQVSQWQTVFDEHIYALPRVPTPPVDPLFNTNGWRPSYDGAPIPLDEMLVWADDIVAHVRRRRPRRVLEIGAAPACCSSDRAEMRGLPRDRRLRRRPRLRPRADQPAPARADPGPARPARGDRLPGPGPGVLRCRDPELRRPVLSRRRLSARDARRRSPPPPSRRHRLPRRSPESRAPRDLHVSVALAVAARGPRLTRCAVSWREGRADKDC